MTLLFDGQASTALAQSASIERRGEGYHATLEGRLDLVFTPLAEAVELGGARSRVCRVEGSVGERSISCLGIATETTTPPPWAELDAIRAVSALFAEDRAVMALARRPRGARGHGEELVIAYLLAEGEMVSVEDARLSTVYDGEGRQRTAGLELWLAGEDLPRRVSGTVTAGTSLELDGLRVHTSIFSWRMDGLEGVGAYDVFVRSPPPDAA